MVAMFGDKLKGRYLLNKISCLSVDKATHENTHFSWRSVQLKTYDRIYKARATHPKETIPSLYKSKNKFLVVKPSKSKIFHAETDFFLHRASWNVVAYIKVASTLYLFIIFSFSRCSFFLTFFSHIFVSCLFDLITVKCCFS